MVVPLEKEQEKGLEKKEKSNPKPKSINNNNNNNKLINLYKKASFYFTKSLESSY